MKLKDILAKLLKGEALTDAEKAFVAEHDPDTATNNAAAAARRQAEQERDRIKAELETQLKDLQTKLAEGDGKGKTELQKAMAELEKLQKQVSEMTKSLEGERSEKSKLIRAQKIEELARASGIQFIKDVDAKIMARALAAQFDELTVEDLADAAKVKPIIDTFKATNRAVIFDGSGHGSGTPPGRIPTSFDTTVNPWKKETLNLTKQGEILEKNPQLAAQMKAAAGAK